LIIKADKVDGWSSVVGYLFSICKKSHSQNKTKKQMLKFNQFYQTFGKEDTVGKSKLILGIFANNIFQISQAYIFIKL
jgi:hypothetical protein